MSWPVPEFPVKRDAPGAKITLWLGLLFAVLALIFLLDFYIFKLPLTEVLIFIYLPYILIWMCLFTYAMHRHEQARIACQSWNASINFKRNEWVNWCQRKLMVTGVSLLMPKNVKQAYTSEQKRRTEEEDKQPLAGYDHSVEAIFTALDKDLNQQHEGYQSKLKTVYVVTPNQLQNSEIERAVTRIWGCTAEIIQSPDDIGHLFDEEDNSAMWLLAGLNIWQVGQIPAFHEMASAILLTSCYYFERNTFPFSGSLSRFMPINEMQLTSDLPMLEKMNLLDKEEEKSFWLMRESELAQDVIYEFCNKAQRRTFLKNNIYIADNQVSADREAVFVMAMMLIKAMETLSPQCLLMMDSDGLGYATVVGCEVR
ncbi:hypothetical protein Q4R27_17190 [Morganella morganii subsp. sibonii]